MLWNLRSGRVFLFNALAIVVAGSCQALAGSSWWWFVGQACPIKTRQKGPGDDRVAAKWPPAESPRFELPNSP